MAKSFCLWLVLLSLNSWGQDTLVSINEIQFVSEDEREAFHTYFEKGERDYFKLFSLSGKTPSIQSKEKFLTYLKGMGYEKMADKKQDKKVKFIYENVHKTFLDKYEAKTLFSDIFSSGNYNCVSATALYCMAFDYFKIPYTIKEKPTHVFPVAYPNNQQVIVETTNPLVGSFAFTDQFKASYIENLRKQKLISSQEMASSSVNNLFDQHFFKEDVNITMQQLVGIQYMNDAIFKLEAEDAWGSMNQFEKAYLFYPSENIANGMLVTCLKAFQQRTKKDTAHAFLLAKLSRFEKFGVTTDVIKGEFGNTTNTLLFDQGKNGEYEKYYATLNKHLRNKVIKEEIDFVYYYEYGRYYYNQGKYFQSQPYFEKAFALRPNNQEIQSIYLQLLQRSLTAATDSKEALDLLQKAEKENPVLATNSNFKRYQAMAYLFKFNDDFVNNRPIDGDKARLQFESLVSSDKDVSVEPEYVGQAYSTAAVYYFKKNQINKAKYYLDKGLELAPNNRELINRKRMIN